MNNNYLTTTAVPAPGRGVRSAGRAQAWLSARCEFPSRLLGCTVSRLAVIGSQLCGALLALAVVLCLDGIAEYGWAATCLLLAARCGAPIVKEFIKEGGEA